MYHNYVSKRFHARLGMDPELGVGHWERGGVEGAPWWGMG